MAIKSLRSGKNRRRRLSPPAPGAAAPVAPRGRHQTYDWLLRPRSSDPRLQSDILPSRVQQAVDRELLAKGYRLVATDNDFRVG